MNKLKAFVNLDFLTIKPFMAGRIMVVFMCMPVILSVSSGKVETGVNIGMILAAAITGYPFAMSDKNDLDTLYTTLSLRRKDVVRGRYIFTIALGIVMTVVALVLSVGAVSVTSFFKPDTVLFTPETPYAIAISAAIAFLLQTVQLPLFFMVEYAKAKTYAMVTILVIGGGFIGLLSYAGVDLDSITLPAYAVAGIIIAVLAVIGVVSYKLSVHLYNNKPAA
ncbi:ABC transporter permease [Clostridia bacterium]|nr:ABC transporter permease [Clostridia bacterium]